MCCYPLEQEVNGGVLNVAEGGYARFRSDVSIEDVTIQSVTDEGSDISPDTWFGGCIYNEVCGSIRNSSVSGIPFTFFR